MGEEEERNEYGQFTGRIPADAALEVFEERADLGRPLTADDVMETLSCSRRTAHNKLNELVDRGTLKTRKVGARGRVWWVPLETESGVNRAAEQVRTTETGPHPGEDEVPPAVRAALEDVELPGSGATLDARERALLAAYQYLVDNPSATKSEFIENVYPSNAAGFETAEGWWNAIHPPLKKLPGVDSPEERGHRWNFLGGDRFTPTLG